MSERFRCPICSKGADNSNIAPAVISPWIRELGIRAFMSKYVFCPECNYGFFSRRYSPTEMGKIYSKYRGFEYTTIRKKWEPWYSEEYNKAHDSAVYINRRGRILQQFIEKNLSVPIKSVLDIGGDRGQYIPQIHEARKFVLEMSDKEPIQGVTKVASIEDIENIDLIIYSHVLEHVVDPVAEIKRMMQHAEYLYVEVPAGLPAITPERKSTNKFLWKLVASNIKSIWIRQSAPSTSREIIPTQIITQSEHLNFFTESSLETIADILDLNIKTETCMIYTPDFSEGRVVQALFTTRTK